MRVKNLFIFFLECTKINLQRRLIYVHCWLMDQLAVTIFKYYIIFLFIFLFFIVYFLFLNKNWNIIYNSYL